MRDINDLIGETAIGFVTFWTKKPQGWSGFFRIPGYGARGSNVGIYFREADILSNINTTDICPGMKATFRIEQAAGQKSNKAVDIDFYI